MTHQDYFPFLPSKMLPLIFTLDLSINHSKFSPQNKNKVFQFIVLLLKVPFGSFPINFSSPELLEFIKKFF